MKNKNNTNIKRTIGVYVVVGVITFTMIFSVFAGLVSAIGH